jgi:hypothetical protein
MVGFIKKYFMGSKEEDEEKIKEELLKKQVTKKNKRLEELKKELGIK